MPKLLFHLLLCTLFLKNVSAQTRSILWYNVENLFDTIDNPNTRDEDFTPSGKLHWNSGKYYHKLNNISKVILNAETNKLPDLIGLCEIENASVLQDLLKRPGLDKCNYSIIHYESPDERGIDVAVLYNANTVQILNQYPIPVPLTNDYTRDILYVELILDRDTIDLYVNHWPSRAGGEILSREKRLTASMTLFRDIEQKRPKNLIILGDFNDEFSDVSLLYLADSLQYISRPIIDHWSDLEGDLGSYAYKGNWSRIDQILSFCTTFEIKTFRLIDNSWLLNSKNEPLRTYSGPKYIGGFSDHLPILIELSN